MLRLRTDSQRHAQLYTATKGRSILIRPTRQRDVVGCVLMVMNPKDGRLEEAPNQDVKQQKQLPADIFHDAG